jgi:hypothetical protein
MRDIFRLKYDLSSLPCDIRFNRIQLRNQQLEIS